MLSFYKCEKCKAVFHESEIQWEYEKDEIGYAGDAPAYDIVDTTRCPNCGKQETLIPYYPSDEEDEKEG